MKKVENERFSIKEQKDKKTLVVRDHHNIGDVHISVKKDEVDGLIELLKQAK